jgi:plastocyanin
MAGIVRVVEEGQVAAIPTAVAPPQPTPQPTAAQPPAEPLGPQSVGYGAFSDSESARSDTFHLQVSGLPSTTGEYHAWLTGDGLNQHLGALSPDAQGGAALTFVSPTGENLLARYSGFVVTVEAAGSSPNAPSTQLVLGSSVAEGVRAPLQQLLVASSDAPEGTPYALGLIGLSEELFRHAKAVNGASIIGDFDGMNRHIEHMLTIIQGQGGEHYRDFDNDGAIQDPGDGFGILRYAEAVGVQAAAASAAPGASENVRVHAAELLALAANMREWGNQVVDLVILAHQSTVPADQQSYAGQALALTREMLDGVDANGNGQIEAVAGEGGAYTAYFSSQYLAALGAIPEAGSGVATPVPPTQTPEPTDTPDAESTPEPTTAGATTAPERSPTAPPPTATTAPAQPTATPAPVFITYSNFVISPSATTITVGTTVTFLIRDSLHQPYNFTPPNTFESLANLGDGQTYQHTFTEAGTITILCGYHGNMSATLTIQP